jgi:UDP-N-acetylmuramoyl-tripeptide--D-alanyl-D-alanine ligase
MNTLDIAALALALASVGLSFLRWLRVAQREHYLPGTTVLFARRWWGSTPLNLAVFVAGAAGALVSVVSLPAAFAAAAAAGLGPVGLSLRGKTSKLAWTPRLRRLAAVSGLMTAAAVGGAAAAGVRGAASAAAVCAIGSPALTDVALWVVRPLEARMLAPFVERARRRLSAVAPRVVAVTGSYGKTSTKGYLAHLLSGTFSVVATPASYNNAPGLARSVNEHLPAGAQVFVAEMGTYGRGEIAALCEWVPPDVSVITAIGPVHLERMGSLENIAEAKAEIIGHATFVVLNIDYPLLAQLADKAEAAGKTVWRCSSTGQADVTVRAEAGKFRVRVASAGPSPGADRPGADRPGADRPAADGPASDGPASDGPADAMGAGPLADLLITAPPAVSPGNLACAIAGAICLGAPQQVIASRLEGLPGAPNRRSLGNGPNGANLIDDTYNSNPAGAQAALELLAELAGKGARRVVVTPGMVELGGVQRHENTHFAVVAGSVATDLVVVGRTNAKALLAGARAAGLVAHQVRDRASAVSWMAANLGPGDAVLYENDLPDHYP